MLISKLITQDPEAIAIPEYLLARNKALVALDESGFDLAGKLARGEFARITSALDPACHEAPLLLLVGSESGEPSGGETLAVLFSAVTEQLRGCASRPRVVVQGGIATPEAAAAYLLTGASGVLLESLHWLTRGVPGDEASKQRIAGLRPDHSRVIGQRLGASCRFFDKGNSRAVREMEALADALCASGADETARQAFLDEVGRLKVSPLAARFNADELIPLGPEAAFAKTFADRFGVDTGTALDGFARAVEEVMARGPRLMNMFSDAPAARSLGTRYPILQGGMTWITDKPLFALAVAEAGALPTLALGSRDRARLEADFADLRTTMAGQPYAMNVLVLEENRFRDEQLAWLEEHRPPFVAIAAGDPSFAVRLKNKGMRTIYLCPDEGLLRLALEAEVDFVVLEGTEAGGHVGSHSTQMLAQMALEARRREPRLFERTHVVLAGGVYDRASAFRALVLGAEAVQLGTAYLATEEIVATGALPALYQRLVLEARPSCTAVSGETVGLRVRSLRTPRMEAILELERDFAAGNEDEKEFRKRLESLSVGTLLIATRQMRRPGTGLLDEETCRLEGQYMSGAVAGCIGTIIGLQDLHRELAEGRLDLPRVTPQSVRPAPASGGPRAGRPERIAITGLALANALGHDEESFWRASLAMRSGVVEVPASRWDHARFFDANPRAANKTYSPVGAFCSLGIGRRDLWVTPQDFRTMSGSMRMSLLLAGRAIAQAGLEGAGLPPERVSVIVSQNSGEVAGSLEDQIAFLLAEDMAEIARKELGINSEQVARLVEAFRAGRMGVDDTTLIGRLNCTAAGHISNRFGFMGPSYSVGAACATSLVALHSAAMLMRQGVIDAAVVGGGEEPLTSAHYIEFSALGALAGLSGPRSRPEAYSRPFDRSRDGFVMGEGGAMLVIERESTALARGARPLAYITGLGAANNDKGIVESVADSQVVALRLSFEDAGFGPDEVGLIECHATSTVQGDQEEVTALRRIFPVGSGAVLAGLKSQIGHTLGASGVTAIGRAVMAMRDGVLPGTLNVDEPDPAMGIAEHGFRVLNSPERWPEQRGPRRAQVNAFGFGGASFVIHLEGVESGASHVVLPVPEWHSVVAEADLGLRAFAAERNGRSWRVVTQAKTAFEARSTALKARPFPADGEIKALAALARKGVYAAPAVAPAPAALVLSGQGGFYPGMGKALYKSFPVVRTAMDRMAAVADFDLLSVLFNADEDTLRQTRWQQPALFTLEYAIARQIMDLGFAPTAMAGHSLGELTALTLAGVMTPEDGFRVVNRRGLCMDRVTAGSGDHGAMVATGAPPEIVERLASRLEQVVVTNYNSPRQTVFGGATAEVLQLADRLQSLGFRCTRLAVNMAFHSPLMRGAKDEFAAFLTGIDLQPPCIPVMSNVTREPFPAEAESIRRIMVEHLTTAVAWTSNVQSLWLDYDVRLFVEVGPGQVLRNLVGDIFEQSTCLQTCVKDREPEALREALARLHASGHLALPVEDGVLNLDGEADPVPIPVPAVAVETVAAAATAGAAPKEGTAQADTVLERVIAIIMEATGYERSEIEPDMDIRQDLAIRSSRLPVIMDQAERQFDIVIRIEDFIGVNTVREMASRIEGICSAGPASAEGQRPVGNIAPAPVAAVSADGPEVVETTPVSRLGFVLEPVEGGPVRALTLNPQDQLCVVALGRADDLVRETAEALGRLTGVQITVLCSDQAVSASAELERLANLVGLVFVVGEEGADESLILLTRAFALFKALLARRTRRLALALRRRPEGAGGSVLLEGITGMFLAGRLEYGSLPLRVLDLDRATGLDQALVLALDAALAPVQTIWDAGTAKALRAVSRPVVPTDAAQISISPGDVVVVSGGGRGVTARVARTLAAHGPHLVLLGRSPLDEACKVLLKELRARGAGAEYVPCDVTDGLAVERVMADVAGRLGRIDGVVHGAGLLRDGLAVNTSEEDFALVCAVKVQGLRNLLEAGRHWGLRFALGFSSVAAWQGNVGQTSYCAANRAMAALLAEESRSGRILARAAWLPPIEGAGGMADDPQTREFMRLKGLDKAFVHVDEFCELLARELACGPAREPWVMFARPLPVTDTVPATRYEEQVPAARQAWGLGFPAETLPMVDGIAEVDLAGGRLTTLRTFSHDVDLWLGDHRPHQDMRHPLVSAVMAVESFLEGARLAVPYLHPQSVTDVRFRDMIVVAPEMLRQTRMRFTRDDDSLRAVMEAREVSPTGRALEQWTPSFEAVVHLGHPQILAPLSELAFGSEAFDNHKLDRAWSERFYDQYTGLTGRYRVLDVFEGTGEGIAGGSFVYPDPSDFAGSGPVSTVYAPYLLEAMLHLGPFYALSRGLGLGHAPVPARIDEVRLGPTCQPGTRVQVRARMRGVEGRNQTWDAQAVDENGVVLLQALGVTLTWIG